MFRVKCACPSQGEVHRHPGQVLLVPKALAKISGIGKHPRVNALIW
jgi:hypothetical protein